MSVDGAGPLIVLMAIESGWSIDIASALSAAGHAVIIAYPQASEPALAAATAANRDRLERSGCVLRPLRRRAGMLPYPLVLAAELRRIGRAARARGLITLYGGNFAVAAWLSGIRPYAIYWVGSDINLRGRLRELALALPAKGAALNVTNGLALAERARRVGMTNVWPLYHGIDTDFWTPGDAPRKPRAVCARRFEPVYDNATIVRAFQQEDAAATDLGVVFTADGSLLEPCRALARGAGSSAPDRIEFVGGGVEPLGLRDYFRESEIYASMSSSDGASTALLQAMSAGCFPVVSDITANREWRTHGCDMELVPVGSAGELWAAISRVHADPERQRRASVQNREVVCRKASLHTNIARLAERLLDNAPIG